MGSLLSFISLLFDFETSNIYEMCDDMNADES